MATYHKVESKINISELFYAKDESETQQQVKQSKNKIPRSGILFSYMIFSDVRLHIFGISGNNSKKC